MLKREKRRYLALTAVCEQPPSEEAVLNAVQASVHTLFGEYGASKANLRLIKKRPEKEQIVVCCSHKALEQVRAAIASTTVIDGKAGAIHVLGVSGTLKALSKKTETS
jgi:RNase P/RNase MRP subunit POP5